MKEEIHMSTIAGTFRQDKRNGYGQSTMMGAIAGMVLVIAALTPQAQAAVLAYEDFNYSNADCGDFLVGSTYQGYSSPLPCWKGTGWPANTPWINPIPGLYGPSTKRGRVATSSMTFPAGVTYTTSGRNWLVTSSLNANGKAYAARMMGTPIDFGASNTFFMSFLIRNKPNNSDGYLLIQLANSGTSTIGLNVGWTGSNKARVGYGLTSQSKDSVATLNTNSVYFMVARIVTNPGTSNDSYQASFYSPTDVVPYNEPGSWTLTYQTNLANQVCDVMAISCGDLFTCDNTASYIDEIRVGTTWADVTGNYAPPVATAATGVTASGFIANWTAAIVATNYSVDVATDSGFTSFVSGWQNKTVGLVTTTNVNSGLSAGSTYYYRLRTQNNGVVSTNSNTISVTLPPLAPTGVQASDGSSTTIVVTWSDLIGEVGYTVWRNTVNNPGTATPVSGLLPANTTAFQEAPPVAGQVYWYWVVASSSGGDSPFGTPDSGFTPPAANIATGQRFAWSENTGWINFAPTHGGGATVVSAGANGYLSGYAWSENLGWIKLGDGTGPYANNSATDWGVNMDAAGNLSGYAWSENAGWINVDATHGQVVIATTPGQANTGNIGGFAWGENVGWVHFRDTSSGYGVRTTVFGAAKVASVFRFR
jgi:hypothetical protein